MRWLFFMICALACAPSEADAQLSCSLNMTPVQFDNIAGTSAGTFDARGTVTVTCTGSQGSAIAACVEIGQGAAVGALGQRLLASVKSAGTLPVQIFQDPTLSRPWGTVSMSQAVILQRTGDGPMSATVYLRAYIQKGSAVPGTHTGHFPVILRYGAVTGNFADCNALATVAVGPVAKAMTSVLRATRKH